MSRLTVPARGGFGWKLEEHDGKLMLTGYEGTWQGCPACWCWHWLGRAVLLPRVLAPVVSTVAAASRHPGATHDHAGAGAGGAALRAFEKPKAKVQDAVMPGAEILAARLKNPSIDRRRRLRETTLRLKPQPLFELL